MSRPSERPAASAAHGGAREREPGPSATRRRPEAALLFRPLGPGSRCARPGHDGRVDVKQPRKLSRLMVRSAARRVSNHEGTQVDQWPPILRDGPSGLLRMRRCWQSRDATQRSLLHSRAAFVRRGSSLSVRIHPPTRGWRSADRRTLLLCRACEARRPRERNAGRPVATGTPSRRSVVAIFGRGPVLPPPAVAPEPASDLPASEPTA